MPSGNPTAGGNPSIMPVERHHTLGRLQGFLLEYLGTAPDAAARAKEMAVKFEEHVFKATSTKEDYVQTIQARMKLVQAKKGQPSEPSVPEPTEETNGRINISDGEKTIFLAKMEQFKGLIPRMEKLIDIHTRLGTNPEMIRKYAGYKNVVQRQLELLSSNVFIMSLAMVSSIFEQSTKMTVYLATRAKEVIASNPELTSSSSTAPKQAKQRPSIEEVLKRQWSDETIQQVPPIERLSVKDIVQIGPDMLTLEYELDVLVKEGFLDEKARIEQNEAGVFVNALMKGKELILRLPKDYPSAAPLQVKSAGATVFVDFSQHIIAPVTLTSTIRLLHCR